VQGTQEVTGTKAPAHLSFNDRMVWMDGYQACLKDVMRDYRESLEHRLGNISETGERPAIERKTLSLV